jgi:hypothetical protein
MQHSAFSTQLSTQPQHASIQHSAQHSALSTPALSTQRWHSAPQVAVLCNTGVRVQCNTMLRWCWCWCCQCYCSMLWVWRCGRWESEQASYIVDTSIIHTARHGDNTQLTRYYGTTDTHYPCTIFNVNLEFVYSLSIREAEATTHTCLLWQLQIDMFFFFLWCIHSMPKTNKWYGGAVACSHLPDWEETQSCWTPFLSPLLYLPVFTFTWLRCVYGMQLIKYKETYLCNSCLLPHHRSTSSSATFFKLSA